MSLKGGLRHFGGEARRLELFEYIKKTTAKPIPNTFINTLQSELERLSSDSDKFAGGADIFYCTKGKGGGVWGLRNYEEDKSIEVDLQQDAISYPEGKEVLRKHIIKERNPKLIRDAKNNFIQKKWQTILSNLWH